MAYVRRLVETSTKAPSPKQWKNLEHQAGPGTISSRTLLILLPYPPRPEGQCRRPIPRRPQGPGANQVRTRPKPKTAGEAPGARPRPPGTPARLSVLPSCPPPKKNLSTIVFEAPLTTRGVGDQGRERERSIAQDPPTTRLCPLQADWIN